MAQTGTDDIHVVTDSTSAIPLQLVQENPDLTQIPLTVVIGPDAFLENEPDVSRLMFEAIGSGAAVSTSQPSPGQFVQAYQRAADEGASGIVSIHISGELSGTVQSAKLAAAQSPIPVRVIDSRSVGMGLGFAALAAAKAARDGADLDAVAQRANRVAASARVVFFVDDLDHLRKGGRLTGAASAIGTVLGVRPLLEIRKGSITVVQKVRSRATALHRLQKVIIDSAGRRAYPVVAVHHFDSDEPLDEIVQRLSADVAGPVYTGPTGAVLGAHAGPGVVAFVVSDLGT